MIRMNDVTMVYDNGTRAVNKANLRIDEGEFVFLVGASGSGKTTMIKLLTAEDVYKRQVKMEFAPYPEGDYLFEEKIFGGSVPKNFHPAVDKGIREAMEHGVLAGYPLVGLHATLLDGSYHDVDSNELSFKMAARLAYKAGIPQASPVLLEPVCSLRVVVPDSVSYTHLAVPCRAAPPACRGERKNRRLGCGLAAGPRPFAPQPVPQPGCAPVPPGVAARGTARPACPAAG